MGASYDPRGGSRRARRQKFFIHNGRRYRDGSDVERLCIASGLPGELQTWYFPKVTIMTDRGPRTLDALVKVQKSDRVLWVSVEIDEAEPTPESLERERAVPLPTLRVAGSRLLKPNFVDWFNSRLEQMLNERGEIERAG